MPRRQDIQMTHDGGLSLDAVFLGGFLLMGTFQFALFLLDRKKRVFLFMALICLLALVFACMKNPLVLQTLLPGLGWELRSKLIHLTLLLASPILSLYAYNLHPRYLNKHVNTALSILSLAYLIPVLIGTAYFPLVLPMKITLLGTMVYIIVMLFIGFLKQSDKQVLYSMGGMGFLLSSLFMADGATFLDYEPVAAAFFVFILYQAFLQASLFSQAFRQVDLLNRKKIDLEKRNVELFSQSYIDTLTGTCNRRLLDDYLSSLWRTNILCDKNMGMIIIDVDDFKNFNKSYGHQQGDICLVKVSEALRTTLLNTDENFLARYEGEEFVIVLSDVNEVYIHHLAEKLRRAVEDLEIPNQKKQGASVITISLGCTIMRPSQHHVPEHLFDTAFKAVSRAKDLGGNKTEVFLFDSFDKNIEAIPS